MPKTKQQSDMRTQAEKFQQTARELGVDEDEQRWEERLKKVVKHKVPRK